MLRFLKQKSTEPGRGSPGASCSPLPTKKISNFTRAIVDSSAVTQSEDSVSVPLYNNSIFLISHFSFILILPPLFTQAELSEEIQLISAFLHSLTDDSTTSDDAGVNKQASPDAAGSNE